MPTIDNDYFPRHGTPLLDALLDALNPTERESYQFHQRPYINDGLHAYHPKHSAARRPSVADILFASSPAA